MGLMEQVNSPIDLLQLVLPVVLAATLVPLILLIWLRRGHALPLDVANERSLHSGAVPRIGGVAMMMASTVGITVASWLGVVLDVPAAILLACLVLFSLSVCDDWRPLGVLTRLAGHLLAAMVVVVALDVPVIWAVPVTLALVWMTNLYNFMDGADGLAGSMAVVGFIGFALAAWPKAPGLAVFSLVIAAAALGFLTLNFPPARVFMGDAGSVPLGFLAGSIAILGWRVELWPAWYGPMLFAPFILDATLTLWRRLRRGERVWQAHRQHLYQRLVLRGWTHRRLVLSAGSLMVVNVVILVGICLLPEGIRPVAAVLWLLGLLIIYFGIDRYCRRGETAVR